MTPTLKSLWLLQTKSKRPSLDPLSRFTQLETIYLEGQQKDIEVLSGLSELRDVTLRSISTPGLEYLKPLHKMWSLDLKLGGIRDLSAIAGMDAIRYFEAWQVRGLSDLDVISALPGLQYLFKTADCFVIIIELKAGKLRIADYGGQDVVEVVGNTAGQGSNGLHLLGLLQLLL